MKKIFYLMLIALIGITACSKNEDPLKEEVKILNPDDIVGLVGQTITHSNPSKESLIEILIGANISEIKATNDPASASWCSVLSESVVVESEQKWKVTIKTQPYTGNDDRIAYITIKGSESSLELQLIQQGRAKRVRMIVVNEGQFTKGTAAISAIRYDGSLDWDIFRSVNNRPLGDVAQSISYIDGKYFVVLNNSRKIEVIEPTTFQSIQTINYEQSSSPRFMVKIDDKRALVSDLQRQLTIVDTKDYKVLEYIDITSTGAMQIEKMTEVGNKIFCAALGKGVAVLDKNKPINAENMRFIPGTGSIMKTAKMILDKNNMLWVMCTASGKTLLHCINTSTEAIDRTVEIPYIKKGDSEYEVGCITGGNGFNRIDTDASKGKLYFLMQVLKVKNRNMSISAIITLDVDKKEIDKTPYRELPGLGMMYGMNVSPQGDVFLCDCLDYTAQRGFLREYKADENVVSLRVGVYPRMVHFTEYDN